MVFIALVLTFCPDESLRGRHCFAIARLGIRNNFHQSRNDSIFVLIGDIPALFDCSLKQSRVARLSCRWLNAIWQFQRL